jgi:putative cardiolipin synthase
MRKSLALILHVLLVALTGCASLPTDVKREVSSHTDRDADPSRMASAAAPYLRKHPDQSGFWLLGNGLDAFAARIVLAEAAQRTIDVQYYLYHNDLTGRFLTHTLLRAADRGVRVRLLLDDMTTKGIDSQLAALDTHPNLEVRILNPYANRGFRAFESLARFDTVTRRMHNKSFTVDNALTIVGGRNVGDEYYAAHEEMNFGDMDVLTLGPAAVEVGEQFDLFWNNTLAYPIDSLSGRTGDLDQLRRDLASYADEQRDSPYALRVRTSRLVQDVVDESLDFKWGQALVFYDLPEKLVTDPENRSTHLGPKVRPALLGKLNEDLLIFSPYFIPGDDGVKSLTDLEKKGIQVRVVTNSLASTDVGLVHAGYAKYREPLLRGGVEIYEVKPDASRLTGRTGKLKGSSGASLHAKTLVVDRDGLFIGSPNLDPRSGKLNTELGILFESEPLAGAMVDWFDQERERVAYRLTLDREHCKQKAGCKGKLRWIEKQGETEVVYMVDPHSGALKRFLLSVVALLPIESQL